MTIRPAGFPARTPTALPAWCTAILHRMRHRGSSGRRGAGHDGAGRDGAGRSGRAARLAERLDRAEAVRAEAERRRMWL
ncbi:hypothetical protein [Leifsonia sp. Root227]|uniref:hypothetical protein n=1 Tax=Leifsonia sp. Root227 TaxID=1736496 RepID=UPI0012FA9D29|nr:hypothetical protein [Leifsonia sp. Root227]